MLIRFEVENFRSILEPAELSMVAVDRGRVETRAWGRGDVDLITAAGIYGPNASGKSNILGALAWLRSAVFGSLREWDEAIPIEPFAFAQGRQKTSSFALEMTVREIRYDYLLELSVEGVVYEALFHYPAGKRRRIFEREGTSLTVQRGLGDLSGTRSLLTDRSLALTIMRRFDVEEVRSFSNAVLNIRSLGRPLNGFRRPPLDSAESTLQYFGRGVQEPLFSLSSDDEMVVDTRTRRWAMALLQLADLGITDVEVEEIRGRDVVAGTARRGRRPRLVHRSEAERLPFDYRAESAGTQAWFELIGPVTTAIDQGSVVLFDEIEAGLHPSLTAQLVRLFQDPGFNSSGAQLLFTSHDTNLLGHLNRDEVWLTQKSDDGATQFGALSDFAGERVRRSQNIESGYLSGRFGALPDISNPGALRELGLL